MKRRQALAVLIAGSAFGAFAQDSRSNTWSPNKPVRIIVPFGPGGASDNVARMLSAPLAEELGTAVVIDNRAGAAGNIGMEMAAKSTPDGYTVFLGNISTNAINQWTYADQLKVSPLRDLIPVSMVATVPSVLVSSARFPASTVKELVEHVRKNPGKVNHTSAGAGSYAMIDMLELEKATGLSMTHVPYKGGAGQFINGLVAGDVDLAFTNVSSVSELVKAGRLKALAVTSQARLPELPTVPTMAEAGYPGIGTDAWQGIFVPAGTPVSVVDRLQEAVKKVMQQPTVRDSLTKRSIVPAPSQNSAEFATFVSVETTRWEQIVKAHKATLAN
ncbi:LacI family transcriptional regulator [Xenophilus aerolatus]|nr:LacI family transcriptional regulator [Xenophilus aerolatus]